jgi:hypothetical protein
MWTGERVNLMSRRFERSSNERDRRAFAVGARDVDDRRQLVLWPAKTVEQRKDAVEAKAVTGWRQL